MATDAAWRLSGLTEPLKKNRAPLHSAATMLEKKTANVQNEQSTHQNSKKA